jgi:signal transduction histidine kinase
MSVILDSPTLPGSLTARPPRRWVAFTAAVLSVATVLTAFTDDMPVDHHTAVPIATLFIAAGWAIELSGLRTPRMLLIAANVLPNVWMALIHHSSVNYLFLLMLVAWVGVVGTRSEGIAALAFSLATIAVDGLVDAADGRVTWAVSISWVMGLLIFWLMSQLLVRQERLMQENAELHERAKQVAVLEERQRLARELHDSVTQSLYGMSLHAEAAGRALADGDPGAVDANLKEIRETSQEALGEMRLLLFELRPPLLAEHGLIGALRSRLSAVEARAGLLTELHGDGEARLDAQTEQELFRLAQEALNNVLKHAHAHRVTVRLDVTDVNATLEVADDGLGFEPALKGGTGFGLPGMRERAERVGGALEIESEPGGGTTVRVTVPR